MNYEPRWNHLLQFDLVTVSEEDEISVALMDEVRQFGGLGLGVHVENLEALRQLLEVRLAANPGQLEVFMPPMLPHFPPPSDAMAAVPPDPARLKSTGPDSQVMRTEKLVPAALGLWWDIVFGWEGIERGRGSGREGGGLVVGKGEGVVGRKGVHVSGICDGT